PPLQAATDFPVRGRRRGCAPSASQAPPPGVRRAAPPYCPRTAAGPTPLGLPCPPSTRSPRHRAGPTPVPPEQQRFFMEKQANNGRGLRQELRLIWRRGRQVWRLVPARHKLALAGAAVLMAVTSAANTVIP